MFTILALNSYNISFETVCEYLKLNNKGSSKLINIGMSLHLNEDSKALLRAWYTAGRKKTILLLTTRQKYPGLNKGGNEISLATFVRKGSGSIFF